MRHGYGMQTEEDGTKYEGFFFLDKKHGNGRQVSSSGEVIKGIWEFGILT